MWQTGEGQVASSLEVIASRLEAIVLRVEAIALRMANGGRAEEGGVGKKVLKSFGNLAKERQGRMNPSDLQREVGALSSGNWLNM